MTNLEFQTVTDLQRVRTIRAELDALEASENVGDAGNLPAIVDVDLMNMRRDVRKWEKTLQDMVTIKAQRADAGRSRTNGTLALQETKES